MKYALALLVIAASAFVLWHRDARTPVLSLSTVEIADTPEERERGLSGRSEIPDDYGMLFVFPEKGEYAFWMKEMMVPIDILWLSDDYVVEGISHNVATSTYPEAFRPPVPVRYVLETRAGLSEERGYATGTPLRISE